MLNYHCYFLVVPSEDYLMNSQPQMHHKLLGNIYMYAINPYWWTVKKVTGFPVPAGMSQTFFTVWTHWQRYRRICSLEDCSSLPI